MQTFKGISDLFFAVVNDEYEGSSVNSFLSIFCTDCEDIVDSMYCMDSKRLDDCRACYKCISCDGCAFCKECFNCINCTNVVGGRNLKNIHFDRLTLVSKDGQPIREVSDQFMARLPFLTVTKRTA